MRNYMRDYLRTFFNIYIYDRFVYDGYVSSKLYCRRKTSGDLSSTYDVIVSRIHSRIIAYNVPYIFDDALVLRRK